MRPGEYGIIPYWYKIKCMYIKIRIISISKFLIPLLLSIFFDNSSFSQGTEGIRSSGLFASLSLGPSQSQIKNTGSSSVSGIVSGKMYTFGTSAEIGYFFSRFIGVSSGIGFNTYKTPLTLDSYQNKFNTIDSEGDQYEMRVTGTEINEEQKIGFMNVPVYLNFRLPLAGRVGFFLNTGLDMSFVVNKSYSSSGTFTYMGYYPKYNALLYDLPEFGFATNKKITTNGILEVKPVIFFAAISAGFDFFSARIFK